MSSSRSYKSPEKSGKSPSKHSRRKIISVIKSRIKSRSYPVNRRKNRKTSPERGFSEIKKSRRSRKKKKERNRSKKKSNVAIIREKSGNTISYIRRIQE